MKVDYLIVGAGLYGAVFASKMREAGKSCYVIDKREHIAGNIYTKEELGIQVHKYGAHIFHTSDEEVWNYVNQFATFNHYVNSPVARYHDELYNLPFNMNTFHAMWGVVTPKEAMEKLEAQKAQCAVEEPSNLEEQALSLVGRDIYEKLVKEYTEKQWGRSCSELPAFIIRRLPVRFTYDNNYFNDRYQGIPVDGYTAMVERMLADIPVRLGVDYRTFLAQNERSEDKLVFDKLVFTGAIDEFYDNRFGRLEYRSLSFEEEVLPDVDNYQGNAVVNYTTHEVAFTRIIEHKHFTFGTGKGTVITREYPANWTEGMEPYYPVNDERNNTLVAKYKELAAKEKSVIFGGRLGQYQYFDMDKVIRSALDEVQKEMRRF